MRSQWQWIISGVLLLVVGIFILVNPQTVLRAAVIAFGIYMVVEALMSLIVSWQIKSLTGIFRVNSARSIIGLIIGVSATVAGVGASDGQIARWIVWGLAAWFAVSALVKLAEYLMIRRSGYHVSGIVGNVLLSLGLSLLMFLFPGLVNTVVGTTVGIILIALAIFVVVWGMKMISVQNDAAAALDFVEGEWEERKS